MAALKSLFLINSRPSLSALLISFDDMVLGFFEFWATSK